jgi:predicted nucleotidyltransferase component of viral defense system
MNTLLDDQVERAIAGASAAEIPLLPAIEKEILHHGILHALHEHGFLSRLVFFGGTNLRLCYGSSRLSEDLDFKAGPSFDPDSMSGIASVLADTFKRKYALDSSVSPPKQKEGNTKTWTIRITTKPGSMHEPQQRIKLDICTLRSYEQAPRIIANHYAIALGTEGLIINSQSTRESYTDKLIAIALRERFQPRDLWDFAWLHRTPANAVPLRFADKLLEHECTEARFSERFQARLGELNAARSHDFFVSELTRFLPSRLIATARQPDFWRFMVNAVGECGSAFLRSLGPRNREPPGRGENWEM